MPTVMNMRWRGLTPEQYEEARKQVNWEGDTPDGAQFHIAWFEDDGRCGTELHRACRPPS